MTVARKNLRVCQVKYLTAYYDVLVAVDTLDDVNDILQEWALNKFSAELDLPEALIYNKAISEVLTSLEIDEFAYVNSTVPVYMDIPRYPGITGDMPTFPTALDDDDLYVMPACTAGLFSEADFEGYYGEYTIPSVGLAVTEGLNYIGIRFNSGVPEYIKYDTDASFDYSSIIPVAVVILYTADLYTVSYGQMGYGLPEKLIQKHIEAVISGSYTLTASTNYVVLSALTALKGSAETACLAVNTASANNDMFLYYKDADSAWQKSAVTTINNTQYQGTGLESLAGGEFVVNYIYRLIDGTNKMLFNILSAKFASLALATASENVYDIPDIVKDSAVLVGRMIVEKDSTSPSIQKVQKISFGTVA